MGWESLIPPNCGGSRREARLWEVSSLALHSHCHNLAGIIFPLTSLCSLCLCDAETQ